MKKILIVISCVVLLFGLTGCKKKTKEKISWDEMLKCNMNYKISEKISGDIGQFIEKNAGYNNEYKASYTILDMDDDNEDELVVLEESDNPMYLIIDKQELYYGYDVVYRGLKNLKTDGTYISSGGADATYICKSTFEKFDRKETVLASSDSGTYKIGDKKVSKEEWDKYFNEFLEKEDAEFTPYTIPTFGDDPNASKEEQKNDNEGLKVGKYKLEYGTYYVQLVSGELAKDGSGTITLNSDNSCSYIEGWADMECKNYYAKDDKLCMILGTTENCFDIDSNNKIGTRVGNTFVYDK